MKVVYRGAFGCKFRPNCSKILRIQDPGVKISRPGFERESWLNQSLRMLSLSIAATWFSLACHTEAGITGKVLSADGSPVPGALVYIDKAEGNFSPPAAHHVLTQKNRKFIPHVLPIVAGSTVDFLNEDDELHTVHAWNGPGQFNFSFAKAGIRRTQPFDETGNFTLLCDIHHHMRAYIIVLQNPFFALTDEQGRFEILNAPSGSHILKTWHEAHAPASRDVFIEKETVTQFVLTPHSMLKGKSETPIVTVKKEILNWELVITRIDETLQQSLKEAEQGNAEKSASLASDAYFATFEAHGMEAAIRSNISSRRVFLLEENFDELRTGAKKVAAGEMKKEELKALADELLVELKKDAKELVSYGVDDETWDREEEQPEKTRPQMASGTREPDLAKPSAHVNGSENKMDVKVFTEVLQEVETSFAEALILAAAGEDEKAEALVADTYFDHFHRIEPTLAVRWPGRTSMLEGRFAELRGKIRNETDTDDLSNISSSIVTGLRELHGMCSETTNSRWVLFLGSFLIIVREGFEAILIFAALLAYIQRTGGGQATRSVYAGGGIALVASLLTALGISFIFKNAGAAQEVLEGVSLLLASAVLCYVSCWFIGKAQSNRWQKFIKNKVAESVSSGSTFALGLAAFLAVYREGAETVLFYHALYDGQEGAAIPIWGGIAVGAVVLAFIYVAFRKASLRIPIGPFFAGTSLLLYVLAFIFAGQGIFELQEAGWISITPVSFSPAIPLLGLHPTVETLLAQGLLLLIAATGIALPYRQRIQEEAPSLSTP